MEPGTEFIDHRCPGCGKSFRLPAEQAGRSARCSACGTRSTIAADVVLSGERLSSRPVSADARGGYRRRTGLDPRWSSGGPAEPPRWANRWAIIWGVAVLLAVLSPMPIVRSDFSRGYSRAPVRETHWVWFWEAEGPKETETIIGFVAAIGLGLFGILGGAYMSRKGLGPGLFWAAVGIFLLGFLMAETGRAFVGRQSEAGGVLAVLTMMLAVPLIAAGNHARKYRPEAPLPRYLVGGGGLGIVVGFLLPVFSGKPLIVQLFAGKGPDSAAGLKVCCVAFLLYGVFAIVSYLSGRENKLTMTMSVLTRCLMVGIPIAFLLTMQSQLGGTGMHLIFITFMKAFLLLYGELALLAVGIAAWIGPEPETA